MVRTLLILSIVYFISVNILKANNLALPCAGCHSTDGNSPGKTIPSIKNLEKNYFIQAFKEYKDGTRDHYIMKIIANGYSDKEIQLLADYYENKK
ncbi:MAG: cytochrome C [Alphaproteobacteria bacterium TMED93]|nr:MAG: cytochrome C [Alphaproteobacteria bacterium TMED93]|tara:strand:+ start:119 stop:403 length:285 start_codon:yes stop_codon:yes gene_type:complete